METIFAWVVSVFVALFGAGEDTGRFFGYVEGDYVHVAPETGGIVAEVRVGDGDSAKTGELLFLLDDSREARAVEVARANLEAAKASLQDLETGSRSEELTVIEKQWQAALDTLHFARETFDRSERLNDKGVVSASRLDADRTAFETAKAEVDRLEAELAVARLPARQARIEAARQEVKASEAELARAEIERDRRRIASPVDGTVDRVFIDQGEYATAGAPLAAILPGDAVKVRFFVPEPVRPAIAVGDPLLVECSSCAEPLEALVTWMASEAEHTPPVIYSREERAKLVFAAEATFDQATALAPGQPVDVRLAP